MDSRGLSRVSKYEIALLNELYFKSKMIQLSSLVFYIYQHLSLVVLGLRSMMIFGMITEKQINEDEIYRGLLPQLNLFFYTYLYFRIDKDKSYADQLYSYVNDIRNRDIIVTYIKTAFNNLLLDLSFNNSSIITGIFDWSREELTKIFQLQALLNNKDKDDPTVRPLKGVLNMTVSNWILRSRNNYNTSFLYKCISDQSLKKAMSNKQIWFNSINNLNDKREMKVIREIFNNKSWINYEWAKKVELSPKRVYFVSSFCKNKPSNIMMKKYGTNMLGYKTDRIRDMIAPIMKVNDIPKFSQVMAFDILYGQTEIKEELNFLRGL